VIVVGGTTFYIKWFLNGAEGTAPPVNDKQLYNQIVNQLSQNRQQL
jgi:tRNA A37 N6-isopentenylltransferase MiaA